MATAAKLVTVADFLERPEPVGGYEELRRGKIFSVAWPMQRYSSLQHRIRSVMERAVGDAFVVCTEMPFQARPEYELRRADVGVISVARWETTDGDGFILGAPEIVIEVESPLKTEPEFREKEDLCLATGALMFWVVYPDLREVTVAVAEGSRTYRDGDEIELQGFTDKGVAVTELLGPRRGSPSYSRGN